MRRKMTDGEARLWFRLKQLEAPFRRQAPIGPYIVDFLCASARLVVEVDGGQHLTEEGLKADALRDTWLSNRGYDVFRAGNLDVKENVDGVCDAIVRLLAERLKSPPPETG